MSATTKLSGRILLAEDGADNQRLFMTHLSRAGASVEVAENGAVAVEKVLAAVAANEPFDLVFMDMQMPEMDGYTATRQLREKGIKTPVIALTAHAMAADSARCMDAGCTDYRAKPLDKQGLLDVAAKYLHPDTGFSRDAETRPSPSAATNACIRSTYADDPDIRGILDEFVKGLPESAARLAEYSRQQDVASLRRLLHQLKGAGGGYGFDIISSLAANAEEATKSGLALDEIRARVESLLTTMRSIEGYDASREVCNVAQSSGG